jgi:hypothetical protein
MAFKRITAFILLFVSLFLSQSAFANDTQAKVVTAKKGIAMAKFGPGNAALANASWYYDWGAGPRTGAIPAGLDTPEFVPQIWGANYVTTQNINTLKAAQAAGTCKYLLGFNEPDNSGQANMTVAQAISLWPQLMSTGLLLGSPACTYTNTWFTDFMTQAAANNLRVDFICLHTYQPPNVAGTVAGIKTWITNTYNTYKKPIWVTEFGAPDCHTLGWCGGGTAPVLTQAEVDTYVADVIKMLEDCPSVQRYAWFVDASQAGFELSALFNSDGTLTKTGTDFRDAQGTAVVQGGFQRQGNAFSNKPLFGQTEGRIVCRLPPRQVHYRISIFDMTGRTRFRFEGQGSGETLITPRELTFAKGLYMGLLETGEQTARARFFVQR